MPFRRAHLSPATHRDGLESALSALRVENSLPTGFPAEVMAEAALATAGVASRRPARDLRQVPFVTLDPAGSTDLDQAFHIAREAHGFTLRYAIADVPSFVRPGGAIDAEARLRGQTLYLPDGIIPLHPSVLSEDQASLLPGADRSAFVWTIPLDAAGAAAFEGGSVLAAHVERARIRSRAQLDYVSGQRVLEELSEAASAESVPGAAGAHASALEQLVLLRDLGTLRIAQEEQRGGASLNMPDEEIVHDADGYRIERRSPLPIEDWNAQLSLLTGMLAARIMIDGGIGILRTMPAPEAEAVADFRGRVAALGLPWRPELDYGAFLRSVPRNTARGIAALHAASSLFRGADYTVFGPGPLDPLPEAPAQAAIAAPYAHVTAPLRRLVDRWGLVICEALCAGSGGSEAGDSDSAAAPLNSGALVPEWVYESLPELPSLMRASSARAGRIAAEALDRVEAALLQEHLNSDLDATVLEVRGPRARVLITDPPVTAAAHWSQPDDSASPTNNGQPVQPPITAPHAPADIPPAPGTSVIVRVLSTEVSTGKVELAIPRGTRV